MGYEGFRRKIVWMYANNGKIGCTPYREVNKLEVRTSRGVNICTQ